MLTPHLIHKADYVDDPAERIDRLLSTQERRIANIFRTAIAQLKDDIDLDQLADLLQQGRLDEALDQLKEAADKLGVATNIAFVTSGQSTADFLTAANVGRVVFDQVNTRAVAAMQANRLETIAEFTDEQRKATSLALISGVEAGSNPRVQARNFRDSIGLTEQQWKAVAAYRTALEKVGQQSESAQADALTRALRDKRGDSQVRRAIRQMKPLPPEKIDWMVQRYSERYVKYRSEVIGRTEALRAVHEGNNEMYQQAIDAGTFSADDLERKWVTHLDGRERDWHRFLAGKKAKFGEPWVNEKGAIRYPGDPLATSANVIQCRCGVTTRISTR